MKKKILLGLYITSVIAMTGCVSTGRGTNSTEEYEFDYKEFSFSKENLENLYKTNKRNITIKNCPGGQDYFSYFLRQNLRERSEFDKEINEETIEDWNRRGKLYRWDKEQPTFTIKGKLKYIIDDPFHPYKIIINEICDLRTIEEMDAIKQSVIERIDKVKELSPLKFKEIQESFDKKGSEIAKGYIYHGYEESDRNQKLLLNDALEEGHAYYITGLSIDGIFSNYAYNYYSWSELMNGGFSYKESKNFFINFKNQNIKSSIVDLGRTDVIITTGNIGSPIVIGIIGDQIGTKIYYFTTEGLKRQFAFMDDANGFFPGDINLLEQYEKELGITQE